MFFFCKIGTKKPCDNKSVTIPVVFFLNSQYQFNDCFFFRNHPSFSDCTPRNPFSVAAMSSAMARKYGIGRCKCDTSHTTFVYYGIT